MKVHPLPPPFEILVKESFSVFSSGTDLEPFQNKWILSLINDFEDKKWRHTKFEDFIWGSIADTALSHRERHSLAGNAHASLREAAKNLRLVDRTGDDPKEGSELAEICLYGIMRQYYGALPVVPKIFYKQNNQDNAKGSDSVHIILEEDGELNIQTVISKFQLIEIEKIFELPSIDNFDRYIITHFYDGITPQ